MSLEATPWFPWGHINSVCQKKVQNQLLKNNYPIKPHFPLVEGAFSSPSNSGRGLNVTCSNCPVFTPLFSLCVLFWSYGQSCIFHMDQALLWTICPLRVGTVFGPLSSGPTVHTAVMGTSQVLIKSFEITAVVFFFLYAYLIRGGIHSAAVLSQANNKTIMATTAKNISQFLLAGSHHNPKAYPSTEGLDRVSQLKPVFLIHGFTWKLWKIQKATV